MIDCTSGKNKDSDYARDLEEDVKLYLANPFPLPKIHERHWIINEYRSIEEY